MSECRDCAYSDRPTYKWPCSVCRDTKNGRSMYCPEEADHIANDEGETDYVSRQWLLNEYDKRHKGPPGGARKMIEEAPPADVRPVPKGQWVELPRNTPNPITGKYKCGVYVGCSNCHAPLPTDSFLDYMNESDSKFCYSCGAKMGGADR